MRGATESVTNRLAELVIGEKARCGPQNPGHLRPGGAVVDAGRNGAGLPSSIDDHEPPVSDRRSFQPEPANFAKARYPFDGRILTLIALKQDRL
jgi:hypothetical protein